MNRQDLQTEQWLKANGFNPKTFDGIDIELLKAQQITHRLLKEHSQILNEEQIELLNNFNKAMSNKSLRRKLTAKQCYSVMNIGTKINRQLFKAYKALQR